MADKIIMLKNVRISFPHLFKKPLFNGVETKFSANFLIPKSDKAQVKRLIREFKEVEADLKFKVASGNKAMRDGDDTDRPEQAEYYVLKASTATRPQVINRDKSPITEEDGIIYGGCRVNASVSLWVQDNKWGRRINANLRTIQFVKDDDAFGVGKIDDSDEFEELNDEWEDESEEKEF